MIAARKKKILAVVVGSAMLVGTAIIFWPTGAANPKGGERGYKNSGVSEIPLGPRQKTLADVPLFEIPWKAEPDVDAAIAAAQKSPKFSASETPIAVEPDPRANAAAPAIKIATPAPQSQTPQGIAAVPFGPGFKPSGVNKQSIAAKPAQPNLKAPSAPALSQTDKDALVSKYMKQLFGNSKPAFEDWKILASSKPEGLDGGDLPPVGHGFVMSICRDLQGRIWIGCEDEGWENGNIGTGGVWCYDDQAELAKQWKHFTRNNTGGSDEPNGTTIEAGNFLGDNNGYAIACDKLGRIWVGHLNHGVSVYNGKEWKNYNVLEGPIGERVFAIATSPTDGDVWIATSAGLTRYSLSKNTWSHYTRADGLSFDQASAIAFDNDGNIIIGTQCDGLAFANAKDDYKTWRQVSCPKEYENRIPLVSKGSGLPTNLINDVKVAKDGTIFVATTTGLAWSQDKGRTFDFARGKDWADRVRGLHGGAPMGWQPDSEAVLAEDYISALTIDDNGSLWVGTRQKGYHTFALEPNPANPFKVGKIYAAGTFVRSMGFGFVGHYLEGLARQNAVGTNGNKKVVQVEKEVPHPAIAATPKIDDLNQMISVVSRVGKETQSDTPLIATLSQDWMTRGDWLGRYGKHWICLAATRAPKDLLWGASRSEVWCVPQIGPNHRMNDSLRYWIHWNHTTNPGSLELPSPYLDSRIALGLTTRDVTRRQSEWDDHSEVYPASMEGPDLYCAITIPKGLYYWSLYNMNKDGRGGDQRVRDYFLSVREQPIGKKMDVIDDFATRPELARSRTNMFCGGLYTRFLVKGPTQLVIKQRRDGSHSTILAGMMLDSVNEYPQPYYSPREMPKILKSTALSGAVPKNEEDAVLQLWMALDRAKADAPVWFHRDSKKFFAAIVRWLENHRASGDNEKARDLTFLLATSYLRLGMHQQSETIQRQLGILTARDIEKNLRWKGNAETYPNECRDMVTAYRIAHEKNGIPALLQGEQNK